MSASKLIRPDSLYRQSFIEALREYHAEGRRLYNRIDQIESDFTAFVDALRAERGYPHQPYQDWVEPVPETVLWMVKDDEYIGTVDIRHRINWHLEKWGGHMHFIVRPSMRGKGFGRKMVIKAQPFANYIGIDRALLTVAPDNEPALKIITQAGAEAAGESPATDRFPHRLLYWLDCR